MTQNHYEGIVSMRRMADADGLFGLLMTDAAGPSASDLALIEEMQEAEDAFEQEIDAVSRARALAPSEDPSAALDGILNLWSRVRLARAAAGY